MVQSWRALRVASLEPKPTVRWLLERGMLRYLGHLPGKTFVALPLGDVEGEVSLCIFGNETNQRIYGWYEYIGNEERIELEKCRDESSGVVVAVEQQQQFPRDINLLVSKKDYRWLMAKKVVGLDGKLHDK